MQCVERDPQFLKAQKVVMRESQAELGEIGIELGYRYADHPGIKDNG